MSGLTASVRGADRLAATLADAGRAIESDLDDVHLDAGRLALGAAVIPRRTGHLEQTSTVELVPGGWALTSAARYAGYVHADNPFFSRAVEAKADAIGGLYLDRTTTVLSTVQGA